MLTTLFVLAVLAQNSQVTEETTQAQDPAQTKQAKAAPKLTAAEQAVQETSAKVAAIQTALKEPGLPLKQKNKLKKALMHASARAREAREAAQREALEKAQQAYVEKMMPYWLEQQRQNAQFNLEAAKAQALQQMAITAEQKRRDDFYLQYQRNQIMANQAQSLRQMANP